MSDFDRIIQMEKARDYQLADPDQFVFNTLTAIHASKTRKLRRLGIMSISIILSILIGVQLIFLQQASFSQLFAQAELLLSNKPHYLALLNLSLIGLVLGLKRLRLF